MSQPITTSDFNARLHRRPLNRTWAKVEILLGLTAAGIGLLLGNWSLACGAGPVDWGFAASALALFVLGSYLALAGHRSHLYQSMNEQTAFLTGEIERLKNKAKAS